MTCARPMRSASSRSHRRAAAVDCHGRRTNLRHVRRPRLPLDRTPLSGGRTSARGLRDRRHRPRRVRNDPRRAGRPPRRGRLDRPHAVPRQDSARVGAQFGQAPVVRGYFSLLCSSFSPTFPYWQDGDRKPLQTVAAPVRPCPASERRIPCTGRMCPDTSGDGRYWARTTPGGSGRVLLPVVAGLGRSQVR